MAKSPPKDHIPFLIVKENRMCWKPTTIIKDQRSPFLKALRFNWEQVDWLANALCWRLLGNDPVLNVSILFYVFSLFLVFVTTVKKASFDLKSRHQRHKKINDVWLWIGWSHVEMHPGVALETLSEPRKLILPIVNYSLYIGLNGSSIELRYCSIEFFCGRWE